MFKKNENNNFNITHIVNDACVSNPCVNSGSCVNTKPPNANAYFRCNCPVGFKGDRCETSNLKTKFKNIVAY